MQFSEYERAEQEILKQIKKANIECIGCKECGSQWFQQMTAQQFQANHNVILGQEVPTKPGGLPFYFLKCVYCGNLVAPTILHDTRDLGASDYDMFLDTMEGKDDTREKPIDPLDVIKGLQERIVLLEQQMASKADKRVPKGK